MQEIRAACRLWICAMESDGLVDMFFAYVWVQVKIRVKIPPEDVTESIH